MSEKENTSTVWTETHSHNATEFFRTHIKELSQFLLAEGIDKKALLAVLEKHEASGAVRELVEDLKIAEISEAPHTASTMARISRALRVAARERGALSDFKSVLSTCK